MIMSLLTALRFMFQVSLDTPSESLKRYILATNPADIADIERSTRNWYQLHQKGVL